jgi:hypothetical protein
VTSGFSKSSGQQTCGKVLVIATSLLTCVLFGSDRVLGAAAGRKCSLQLAETALQMVAEDPKARISLDCAIDVGFPVSLLAGNATPFWN